MNRPLIISKLEDAYMDWEHLKVLWDNCHDDVERAALVPDIQVAEKDISLYSALLFAKEPLLN